MHMTEGNVGAESRYLVEEMQIEKRMNRMPMYAKAPDTWQPEPVKKPTKRDYYRLLRTINTRKYEDPKRKSKKHSQMYKSPPRQHGSNGATAGILKKPSMLDLQN